MNPKFIPGTKTIPFQQEERLFLLKWAKTLRPKTELEKRIVKRFLCRLMGQNIYYPLHPHIECPICETNIRENLLKAHLARCKAKRAAANIKPEIDPVVWEMMR